MFAVMAKEISSSVVQLPPIVQIVRRFGPVGGMERYVWELVRGLNEAGGSVTVVCEEVCTNATDDITVLTVPPSIRRPRWKSMKSFRAHVSALIKSGELDDSIIHSHERTKGHHLTTFHGPPIVKTTGLSMLQLFSPRVRNWREMERDEVLGESVQVVLPVSSWLSERLLECHSDLLMKSLKVAWPGVDPLDGDVSPGCRSDSRFLFVGKEWVRKGLEKAVRVIESYRHLTGVRATLDVFGPSAGSLPRDLREKPYVNCREWSASINYSEYAALVHPALAEPFGMVVTEARREGLPVVCSDQTGAGELRSKGISVVSLEKNPEYWARALAEIVQLDSARDPEILWSWGDLVNLHLSEIYPSIQIR